MKNFARIITLVLIVSLLAAMFVGCSAKKKLVGTWEPEDDEGTLTLANDGTGTIKAEGMTGTLTWSVKGDTLSMTITICGMTDSSEMKYKVSRNTLTLTDEDGEKTVYHKVK